MNILMSMFIIDIRVILLFWVPNTFKYTARIIIPDLFNKMCLKFDRIFSRPSGFLGF